MAPHSPSLSSASFEAHLSDAVEIIRPDSRVGSMVHMTVPFSKSRPISFTPAPENPPVLLRARGPYGDLSMTFPTLPSPCLELLSNMVTRKICYHVEVIDTIEILSTVMIRWLMESIQEMH